eukprot:8561057-Pyramimonas_sp.AAC.1
MRAEDDRNSLRCQPAQAHHDHQATPDAWAGATTVSTPRYNCPASWGLSPTKAHRCASRHA